MANIGAQIDRFRVTEGMLVRISGIIDERFPTDAFKDAVGVLAVDLSGVTRMTSFGIRNWKLTITAATHTTHVYFTGVPSWIMAQFGMVAGLGGPRGQILSFLLPYRCPTCEAERTRLFDRRVENDLGLTSPPVVACACGAVMQFDDLIDMYREALAGTSPLNVVPALFTVLSAADTAGRPLKVSKAVDDCATLLWLSGALDSRASLRHVADGLEGDVVLVADQVTACDESGMNRLARLVGDATAAGCRVWLARCAPALEGALARRPDALAPARVVPRSEEAREMPPWMPALLDRRPSGTPSSFRGPFLERYQLVRLLGAGGMAEIYLARQLGPAGFDRRVAVKRILPNLAREQNFVQMFLSEARLAARLSHPNIVQIHELLESDGQYYIVMEYVEGRDLGSLLAAARQSATPIPVEIALRIVAQVCAALDAAHGARDPHGNPLKIVHRDVSPQNVLIGNDGSVKLTDFGVARAAGRIEQTRPGVVKGKVSYLSPEALNGFEPDHRTDLFAVGILLFECLAGFHPFRRATDYQTYQAITSQPLPPVTATRPDVPIEVEAILARATARDPSQRYSSAHDMLMDLEHLIAEVGRPIAPPVIAGWMRSVGELAVRREAAAEEITSGTKTLPDRRGGPGDGDGSSGGDP